jgi:hypothetical protein
MHLNDRLFIFITLSFMWCYYKDFLLQCITISCNYSYNVMNIDISMRNSQLRTSNRNRNSSNEMWENYPFVFKLKKVNSDI